MATSVTVTDGGTSPILLSSLAGSECHITFSSGATETEVAGITGLTLTAEATDQHQPVRPDKSVLRARQKDRDHTREAAHPKGSTNNLWSRAGAGTGINKQLRGALLP